MINEYNIKGTRLTTLNLPFYSLRNAGVLYTEVIREKDNLLFISEVGPWLMIYFQTMKNRSFFKQDMRGM